MSAMIPETGPIFRYGFLASNVSRIIALCVNKPAYELSSENKGALKRATTYMDDILCSQRLIYGQRGQGTPSEYGLKAFQNAMHSLPKVNSKAIDNSEERKILFEGIKKTLNDMADNPKVPIDSDELNLAKLFFGVVGDLYLKEAENKFQVDSPSRRV